MTEQDQLDAFAAVLGLTPGKSREQLNSFMDELRNPWRHTHEQLIRTLNRVLGKRGCVVGLVSMGGVVDVRFVWHKRYAGASLLLTDWLLDRLEPHRPVGIAFFLDWSDATDDRTEPPTNLIHLELPI